MGEPAEVVGVPVESKGYVHEKAGRCRGVVGFEG